MMNNTTARAGNGEALSKYQYRFMALSRADVHAKPCRLSVEAATEQEARRQLVGQYVLSFAGCLPVQAVNHG